MVSTFSCDIFVTKKKKAMQLQLLHAADQEELAAQQLQINLHAYDTELIQAAAGCIRVLLMKQIRSASC